MNGLNLMTVKARRVFTGGALVGIVTEEQWCCDARLAPAIGETRVVDKPVAGSPYVDTITAVYPSPQGER